jgi:hypothetical protein
VLVLDRIPVNITKKESFTIFTVGFLLEFTVSTKGSLVMATLLPPPGTTIHVLRQLNFDEGICDLYPVRKAHSLWEDIERKCSFIIVAGLKPTFLNGGFPSP